MLRKNSKRFKIFAKFSKSKFKKKFRFFDLFSISINSNTYLKILFNWQEDTAAIRNAGVNLIIFIGLEISDLAEKTIPKTVRANV